MAEENCAHSSCDCKVQEGEKRLPEARRCFAAIIAPTRERQLVAVAVIAAIRIVEAQDKGAKF